MSPEEKAKFIEMAKNDKRRYDQEMKSYVPPAGAERPPSVDDDDEDEDDEDDDEEDEDEEDEDDEDENDDDEDENDIEGKMTKSFQCLKM